jgi:meiotically up-regulated gene 157 (Mug157) protein
MCCLAHRGALVNYCASEINILQLFFDDANSPSLLSLPYIGWIDQDNSLYRATRDVILGESNPFFSRGTAGEGIGSPHVPWRFVWPMSIVMRALTSSSDQEITQCLSTLRDTTAGNFMTCCPL